ncbi:unnamed protein product [Microthlaspi erraticum]|uniref:Uncharacterized protein n=1 Tax=Microthlaspi erraticum TaxID=1685480 RepID=A0A6D2L0R3_9BRAS|nr:unnamed protein product [Microthlaspi erraticum]
MHRLLILPSSTLLCIATSDGSLPLISLAHSDPDPMINPSTSRDLLCGLTSAPGSRSSGITQKLDERLHPGTTVHRGTRFILPSIGLTGAPCQCLVGSHIVIWYHTRPRQLTRLSSESSSLHAQPPRCQSGWALTCENALDYTFLNNMWLDTPHVLST